MTLIYPRYDFDTDIGLEFSVSVECLILFFAIARLPDMEFERISPRTIPVTLVQWFL